MKTTLLIIVACSLFALGSQAQQIVGEIGRVTSRFNYENSNGERLDGLQAATNFSYLVGYRFNLSRAFHAVGAFTYNRYGASGSDRLYDNFYSWNATYAGIDISADYEYFKKKALSLGVNGGFAPQLLTGGTQTINNQVYSLKGVEQFNEVFLFLNLGAGMTYCADSRVVATIRYRYGHGLPVATNDTETLKYNTHTISLGIYIGSKRCTYCYQSSLKGS